MTTHLRPIFERPGATVCGANGLTATTVAFHEAGRVPPSHRCPSCYDLSGVGRPPLRGLLRPAGRRPGRLSERGDRP